jgi:hypothetical protein
VLDTAKALCLIPKGVHHGPIVPSWNNRTRGRGRRAGAPWVPWRAPAGTHTKAKARHGRTRLLQRVCRDKRNDEDYPRNHENCRALNETTPQNENAKRSLHSAIHGVVRGGREGNFYSFRTLVSTFPTFPYFENCAT